MTPLTAVSANRRLRRQLVAAQQELAAMRRDLVEARSQALRDPLTKIPNREAFDAELAARLRSTAPFAVLLSDLDGFKPVNDTHGHPVGDAVLVEVAQRLEDVAFTGDMVARLGGDEFALIVDCPLAVLALALHAQPALDVVRQPIHVGDLQVRVTASVGVLVARPGDSPADVMRSVDAALYRAKAAGGNCVVDFGAGPLLPAPARSPEPRLRDANPHRPGSQPMLAGALAAGVVRSWPPPC